MDPSNNQEEIYMSNPSDSQMYANEGGSSSYQAGYPAGGSYPQHGMFNVHQQQQHNQVNMSQQHFVGGGRQQQMQQHQQQAHHHQPIGYSLIRYPSYTPASNHPPTTYYIQQPQQQQQQQQHYYQPQSNHHSQNQQHYTNQMRVPSSNYSNHPNSECGMDVYNIAGQEEVVSLVEEYTMGSMDPQPAPITTSRPAQYTVRIVPSSSSNHNPHHHQQYQRRMEDSMQRRMVSGSVPQFEEEEEEEDEPPAQPPLRHINVGGSVGQTISASHMTPSTSSTVGQMPQLTVRRQSSTEDNVGEPAKQRTRKQILPSTGNRGSAPGANVINVLGGTAPKNSSGSKGTGNARSTVGKALKKEELPVIDKDAAANAQAQANQRIATPQGWRRMNEWIVAAEKASNIKKLRDLLAQCFDSNITKELLLMPSVDTPKIVQKLSKTSADNEIKEKAAQLVRKWRKVATAKDAVIASPKVLKTSENSAPSSSTKAVEAAVVKKSPPQVVHPQTEVGILDKLKEEMSSDPLAKKPPAVPRPKTAKTKLSKPRSTGLEGDEDTSMSSSVAPVRRRAPLAASARSLPLVRTTASTSGGIALAISPVSTVAPSVKPPLPKRSLMLSDSFMDELEDQAVVAKKPKIVRKKISQIAQPISPIETTEGGLYSDTSKPSTSFQPRKESLEEENYAGSLAGEGVLPGRRRVRFADEHGSELVQVKFFEIEEGERINVNRLSSEDMKHLEMSREKNFMREQKGFHMSALHDLPMPFRQPSAIFSINQSGVRWTLVPVDDIIELIEPGSQCEAKVIEARRRNTVMEAFYDATNPLQILEIDDCDYPRPSNHVPAVIPLEPVMAPEEAGQFDNPGASPAMSSSSSSIITQLPLPLTSLSKLTASLPQSVTDLVANLPFMSKPEVKPVEEGPKSPSPKSPTHSPAEIQSPDAVDMDGLDVKKEKSPDAPESPDTEDVDIRVIASTKKEETDSDEDGDTDIRNTLAKSKLDEPTEPKKTVEQPPSVDVLALMNSLKKSGLLNKVQGACVLPAATCSSMSAAMSAAMAAAITTMPTPTVSSPTSMPMQPSPTSQFDKPPPQSMIHRFGVPPPSMPGFLPPFSAPPPQFASSPDLLAAAAANRQFAGNVAATALAVAPFSSPPPCLLPPPGLIQPPGLIVPPAPAVISNRLSLDQVDASDGTTPPGLTDHSSSLVEHKPVATTAPPASLDSNAITAQMPARTFVKQCTYYASGGCHFGEGCRFAHGEEMTVGVKQAMAAVRGGGSGGRGGFRGGPRGGGPPRGPPGNYARPPTGPNPTMNAVGGGVEIDYDEREGKIRTYQVPASHIMISDPRGRGGRGRGRFTSPLRRGYYDERGSGGRYSSNRRRRSRSSSNSLSPVRSGASKGRRSKTRSRSKSPTSSRRSSDRRETNKSSSQRKRRQSRSPMEQTSRRRRYSGKAAKRRSRERSPDLTYSSSGSGDEDRRKPSTYQRQVHTSSSRRRAAEDGGRKSSRNDEDSVLGESSSPGSALLLEITDCLANEPVEPRKNHNSSTAEAMEEDEQEDKQDYSPPRNYKSKSSSSSRRRGKSEHTGSPTSSSSSPESRDPIPAASDSSTTNTPPRKSRATAAASEDEEE